ncbi:MAG TPA: M56 family metallopeptidase, partial [Pirellulaceae bacterium]|nr:M56 family metallopeptidase [Pirellulaceae bacterium]
MSNLIASLAWCWLQVLLVAAAATVLSMWALRRSPTAGATIAWSGVIGTLALTMLAIAPFPLQPVHRKIHELLTSRSPVQPGIVQPEQELHADVESSDEPSFPAASIAPLLAALSNSVRISESTVVRHQSQAQWLLLVVAIGATIGLLRLTISLWAIATLRWRSTVVSDRRATDLISELLPCLPIRRSPQLRQSNDLNSAAVVGWLRPVVMLPADWRDWSHDELKAVLAHELAHIARQDAPWRLVAALLVALHWGQPLMHWLRGQLLLAQELAADELAAAAVGSKREYLRALAKLALLQDSRPAVTSRTAILPVFSGFLLRRIDMLRAMDGSTRRDWRRLTQGTAIALVVVVAILAAAMRGLAEPPETEPDGSIRVAKATDVKAKPAIAANGTANEAGFFQRPPIDIAKMALAKRGGLLFRLGEIFQQPRFAEGVRKSDQMFTAFWKATYPGAEAPPCSLKDIDYV